MTKLPIQKLTQNDTKTRTTSWRKFRKNYIFCVFRIFLFFFSSQKWVKKREFKVQTSSACENHHRSVAEWPMLKKMVKLLFKPQHHSIPSWQGFEKEIHYTADKRAQRALGRSPEEKVKGHSVANNREPQGHNLINFGRWSFDDVIYLIWKHWAL